MLQSHSQQTNKIDLFSKFLFFICWIFILFYFFKLINLFIYYFFNYSVADCLCIKQAILGLIPGGDQMFLILYCLKKPVKEREYI